MKTEVIGNTLYLLPEGVEQMGRQVDGGVWIAFLGGSAKAERIAEAINNAQEPERVRLAKLKHRGGAR